MSGFERCWAYLQAAKEVRLQSYRWGADRSTVPWLHSFVVDMHSPCVSISCQRRVATPFPLPGPQAGPMFACIPLAMYTHAG